MRDSPTFQWQAVAVCVLFGVTAFGLIGLVSSSLGAPNNSSPIDQTNIDPSKIQNLDVDPSQVEVTAEQLQQVQSDSPATSYEITYELDQAGEVSLAVYDAVTGRHLRTLLRGRTQSAGSHRVTWDGLDRQGNSPGCGVYEWRLLRKPQFKAEFLLNLGIKNFPPGGGFEITQTRQTWVGNHDGPYGVLVDSSKNMYVSSPNAENMPHIISRSLDGSTRNWQNFDQDSRHRHGGLEIIERGDNIFVLNSGGFVQSARKKDGAFWGFRGGSQLLFRVVGEERAGRFVDFDALDIARDPHDARRFVISDTVTNELRWYDLDDHETVGSDGDLNILGGEVHRRTLPSPRSVAAIPGETLLVISGGSVQSLLSRNGTLSTVIPASQLTDPTRVAYAPKNDEILVVEGNPRSNQVSRFDRNGNRVQTYGEPGGRAFGEWNPDNFFRITGITANREGGFIVTEAGPYTVRRTVHVDRSGSIREELFGGVPWGSVAALHPRDSTLAMIDIGKPVWGLAKIDYDNRSWELLETYRLKDMGGLYRDIKPSGPSPTGVPRHTMTQGGTRWKMDMRDGKLYMVYMGDGGGPGKPAILRVDRQNKRLVPVAAAGWVSTSAFRNEDPPEFWAELMADTPSWKDSFSTFKHYQGYTWSDQNGNGEADTEEFQLTEKPSISFFTDVHFDEDWNVSFAPDPRQNLSDGSELTAMRTLPNEDISGAAPDWDWRNVSDGSGTLPREVRRMGRGIRVDATFLDDQGAFYQLITGHRHPRDDWQGSRWPQNNIGAGRVVKHTSDGTLTWNVGNAGSNGSLAEGWMVEPLGILGIINDAVVVNDRAIRPAQTWTRDGLFAGFVMEDHVEDEFDPSIYFSDEFPRGTLQKGILQYDHIVGKIWDTDRGVLWQPPARGSNPLYRIHGWSGWDRQEGNVAVLSEPREASDSGVGLNGEYFEDPDLIGKPIANRTDSRVRFGSRRRRQGRDPSPVSWELDELPVGPEGGFSARWTGYVEARFSDTYNFVVETVPGDKVSVWVNGDTVIDWGEAQSNWLVGDSVALDAGREYPIRVKYSSEDAGDTSMHLSWQSQASQERRTIPMQFLFPNADSLVSESSTVCEGAPCLIQRLAPTSWTYQLRSIRDALLDTAIGRQLTNLYYRFFGGEARLFQ